MDSFEGQECQATILRENSTIYLYCCDPHYDQAFTIPSLPFLRLHGIYCHFSFPDKPSERRTCIIPNTPALVSKLDGVKSPSVVNVKTSAIFEPFQVSKTLFCSLYDFSCITCMYMVLVSFGDSNLD